MNKYIKEIERLIKDEDYSKANKILGVKEVFF